MECRATARLWNEAATGRIPGTVATWNEDGGLNASAPVLGEVYQDNVDAGMAYGAESGGLEADKMEQCEDNMCSSEMSSALCEGIQTEIDRVFSNGMFIDNKLHFSDRVELLTELSYHTDHACDILAVTSSARSIELPHLSCAS